MTGDLTPWGILMSWSVYISDDDTIICCQSGCDGAFLPWPRRKTFGDVITCLITHIEEEHGIKLRPFNILAANNERAEVFKITDKDSPTG